jgi:hypothetical protein
MAHLPAVKKDYHTMAIEAAAPRFDAPDLQVSARTIGTKISFDMPVANVSLSGLLLGWKDLSKSPFAVNTILEMEISHPTCPSSPKVGCLGKVVRRFNTPSGQPSFGVKIIQTELDEQQVWQGIISSLGTTMTDNI